MFSYIKESVSPFHTVLAAERRLREAGFQSLELKNRWDLNENGKYYINHHGSSLIAFTMGGKVRGPKPLRMVAAHTDFPCLCIKPHPEMPGKNYAQVNVEVYGGAILNTWMDRPLSAAGKVALKSENPMEPEIRYVDLKKAVFTIPNLAIHMNRDVNKGVELNRQRHMIPLYGLKKDGKELSFTDYLAQILEVEAEDILDYNLYLYNLADPTYVGIEEDFISAPRIDNVSSVYAAIESLIECAKEVEKSNSPAEHINVAAIFDHEEIGSKTKQGAGSLLFRQVLEKMLSSYGPSKERVQEILSEGMLVSADVAHAMHPNYSEKCDVTNQPILGKGFCIKSACSQSYATDSEAAAVIVGLCKENDIPYQNFVNRSDIAGGSTLGSIASSLLPILTVDVGIGILGMHSAVECMGRGDEESLKNMITAFFSA